MVAHYALCVLIGSALPPNFDTGFMLPDSDHDQYDNRVVTRRRQRCDPTTGLPY